MQPAVYGAVLKTSAFGEVGFAFTRQGHLLELSWRGDFIDKVDGLAEVDGSCPTMAQLLKYLNDYARGYGPQFPGEYVFPHAAEFSTKVYKVVEKLKVGQSLSYQQVADLAGSPRACRAVGNIMGKNPLPLVIP